MGPCRRRTKITGIREVIDPTSEPCLFAHVESFERPIKADMCVGRGRGGGTPTQHLWRAHTAGVHPSPAPIRSRFAAPDHWGSGVASFPSRLLPHAKPATDRRPAPALVHSPSIPTHPMPPQPLTPHPSHSLQLFPPPACAPLLPHSNPRGHPPPAPAAPPLFTSCPCLSSPSPHSYPANPPPRQRRSTCRPSSARSP